MQNSPHTQQRPFQQRSLSGSHPVAPVPQHSSEQYAMSASGSRTWGSPPDDRAHYGNVPVVHEEVICVPRKEVIEVEKKVPVYDVQIKERVVEVPQIETVNTEIEVEQVQEVVRRVPVKQRIEVPKDVIKYVTKIVTNVVEQAVEVPGEFGKESASG